MALKHKARPETLKNTSPKSKVQPKEKPMETAGFDRSVSKLHLYMFVRSPIKWSSNYGLQHMILLHHKMIRKPISHTDWILSYTQTMAG